MKFTEMHLSEDTLRALGDLQFIEPTPIQAESIGLLMQGYDIIGQSQTGTGKTAAFAIPIIERIEELDRSLQALVLCPTRELSIQVAGEIRKLLKYHEGIRVLPIYGGQPIDQQIKALRGGVQIVVGTPGRLIDHMNRHTIKLRSVSMVVLDEADEMLDMGFREDIEQILNKLPEDHQTALFSATMPEEIRTLAAQYMQDPQHIHSGDTEAVVAKIRESWFDLKEKMKPEALSRILELEKPELALIFCNTKKRVEELHAKMQARGVKTLALHGDLTQQERDIVMKQFRAHEVGTLIATDVAARGIDIDNIDVVINYDVPDHEEFYVHRIGRTGRAGKEGKAYTFVVGREIEKLNRIMEFTGATIPQGTLPSLSDLEARHTVDLMQEIRLAVSENAFSHELDHFQRMVETLSREGYEPADVAAALLKRALGMQIDRTDDLKAPERLPETDYSHSPKVTLVFNIGSKKKVRVKDIIGAIAGETGIPGSALGTIRLEERKTYVEVPKELASEIIEVMNGGTVKGLSVNVTREGQKQSMQHTRKKGRRS